MEAGDLAPSITAFSAELGTLCHSRLTIKGYDDCARHFAAWLAFTKIGLDEVGEQTLDQFAKHRCRCGGYRRAMRFSDNYLNRIRRFIAFLVLRGEIAPPSKPATKPIEPLVIDYQQWLERHRGVCARTTARHGRMVMRLLPALGSDPRTYNAATIRKAILSEAQRCSPAYTKTMTTALRGYLRFLAAANLCLPGLEHAVPLVPQWRLSSLPRYLSPQQVALLIASCADTGTRGIRDRAILLLLSRLGLRAGDAVLVYLASGRPSVDDDRLFLRLAAPFRPFSSSSTVSHVVDLALKRAGIDDPPSRGANLLRHSAATQMLRGGATLQSVGAVLRHKSLETTTHYAKVDLTMLAQIAQPWPGEATC
jgi:site-specific recombinase XerD